MQGWARPAQGLRRSAAYFCRSSFSDCLLLELARKAGHLPLGTFDRDLSKLAGARKL